MGKVIDNFESRVLEVSAWVWVEIWRYVGFSTDFVIVWVNSEFGFEDEIRSLLLSLDSRMKRRFGLSLDLKMRLGLFSYLWIRG